MTPVQTILERFPDDPFRSARAILRVCRDDAEISTAAAAWCAAAAKTVPTAERPSHGDPWAEVHTLLRAGSRDSGVFSQWVELAREEKPSHDGKPDVRYDYDLLRALAYCWPRRAQGADLIRALCEWGHLCFIREREKVCDSNCLSLALKLSEYPDAAYALLDSVAGLAAQFAESRDSSVHPIIVALERRRHRFESCARDGLELARIVPELVLENDFLWGYLRYHLCDGRGFDLEWQGIVAALDGPRNDLRWYRALRLLAACPDHQARAVSIISTVLATSKDPIRQFSVIIKQPPTLPPGIFSGPGWGRGELPRKLLPITRVLVRKRKWPGDIWRDCFESTLRGHETRPGQDPVEPEHERVREVLAEAFLDRALDEREVMSTRSAALAGIGILQPGGNGGIARAVGKLLPTELRDQAKEVSKRLRDGRAGRTDAELAVLEAWDYFMSHADPASDDPAGGGA